MALLMVLSGLRPLPLLLLPLPRRLSRPGRGERRRRDAEEAAPGLVGCGLRRRGSSCEKERRKKGERTVVEVRETRDADSIIDNETKKTISLFLAFSFSHSVQL